MKKRTSPYVCHLFICTNVREDQPDNPGCGTKSGKALKDLLKEAVNARGWQGVVRVSTSGCLGLCGTGANVMVYPQGLLFSLVTENDVPVILEAIEKFTVSAV